MKYEIYIYIYIYIYINENIRFMNDIKVYSYGNKTLKLYI